LAFLAAATGRVLVLPRLLVDYHVYFLWTFLDLKSLEPGVAWRETNFPSNLRSWKNATHPFSSTARVKLDGKAVGLVADDGPARWARLAKPPPSTSLERVWASALAPTNDAELLLVDMPFADGTFVAALSNCDFEKSPTTCARSQGVPDELLRVFQRLKWCGDTVDLNKLAAKSFQGFDCYGKGRYHGNKK